MAVYDGEVRNDWSVLFSELKSYHDEAYHKIDIAIKLEEEGSDGQAIRRYEEGLVLIDKALGIQLDCPQNPDFSWEKACMMMQKLRKTRKEVLCRIADIQTKTETPASSVSSPPSYEEAMSTTSETTPDPTQIQTYEDLGRALQNLKTEQSCTSNGLNGELIYSVEGVKIYFISPDDTVSSTSEPGLLQIVRLEGGGEGELPHAYLQLGSWIYPLVPGVSPCFRTDYGAFILPDLHSSTSGAAVGIVLPEEADPMVLEILDDILQGVVRQEAPRAVPRISPRSAPLPATPYSYSHTISQALVSGAKSVSSGIMWTATKAADMISKRGTPALVSHLTPASEPRPISPGVVHGVQIAKNVSGKAMQVTGFVANKVGATTVALGRYLAPHVRKQGTRLLTHVMGKGEAEASAGMDGVLDVAAGAVQGISTVYEGLEQSATILGRSLANSTVTVVKHKYGNPTANVTGEALDTVGNVWQAGRDLRHFTTVKGLAKSTAIGTSRGVVEGTGHMSEMIKKSKE